jgi:hypothetical protein
MGGVRKGDIPTSSGQLVIPFLHPKKNGGTSQNFLLDKFFAP